MKSTNKMYFLVNRIPQIVVVGALRRICHQTHIVRLHPIGNSRKYCQLISLVDVDTVDKLKTTFGWTDEESSTIEAFLRKCGKESLGSLTYLCSKNVSISTITQNLHLLNVPNGKFLLAFFYAMFINHHLINFSTKKTDVLKAGIDKMETAQWRKIDDFIPLVSAPSKIIKTVDFADLKDLIYGLSEKYSVSRKLSIKHNRLHYFNCNFSSWL